MVVYDLIVIGAGYWGSGIAFEAKRKGRKVIVIDDQDTKSGSRNASAICDPKAYSSKVFEKYWPIEWSKSDLQESLSWLVERGAISIQEYFWNKFLGTPPRLGSKALYLSHPDILTKLNPVKASEIVAGDLGKRINLKLADGESLVGNNLAICGGYRTDDCLVKLGLPNLGVEKLLGRGIIAKGNPQTATPISVMIKPYQKHTVRQWKDGTYKVGDTAEQVENPKRLEGLREVGQSVLGDYEEISVQEGYRPILDKFTVYKIASRVVVATGGHRLGLGLTGLVAKKTLEMLK